MFKHAYLSLKIKNLNVLENKQDKKYIEKYLQILTVFNIHGNRRRKMHRFFPFFHPFLAKIKKILEVSQKSIFLKFPQIFTWEILFPKVLNLIYVLCGEIRSSANLEIVHKYDISPRPRAHSWIPVYPVETIWIFKDSNPDLPTYNWKF